MSATTELYDQLIHLIQSGIYKPGDQFLTEYQICSQYHTSRATVREAKRMLEANGYVENKKGSGTYILSTSGKTDFYHWIIQNPAELTDYMDVRNSIEVLSIRLFIRNYSADKVEQLVQAENAFEEAVNRNNALEVSEGDRNFHATIAKGTNNALLVEINSILEDTFKSYRDETFKSTQNQQDAIREHRRIIEAIRNRDTNEAVAAMQNHLGKSLEKAIEESNQVAKS